MNDLSLISSWDSYQIDFTHYLERENSSHFSVIDHFLWSQHTDRHIVDAGVLHSASNLSDHSPIYCVIKYSSSNKSEDKVAKIKVPPKPSWKKASQEEKEFFVESANIKLHQIEIPNDAIECQNVHCKSESHRNDIDTFALEIMSSLENAANESLPMNNSSSSNIPAKNIAGWNDEIKPYKEKANFWYQVWISAGRPMNNELHKVMRHTRNIYHYTIRKCKRVQETIKRNKLLKACVTGNGDIFTEIKKLRKKQNHLLLQNGW